MKTRQLYCPFCGANSALVTYHATEATGLTQATGRRYRGNIETRVYYVECRRCHSRGPSNAHELDALWAWTDVTKPNGERVLGRVEEAEKRARDAEAQLSGAEHRRKRAVAEKDYYKNLWFAPKEGTND